MRKEGGPWPALRLLTPITSEVDVAIMPSQKIQESFVVGLRYSEQRQHLLIASSSALESLPDQMLDLVFGYQSFSIWPRHAFPEIAVDHFLQLPGPFPFKRQRYIVRLNRVARRAHCGFDDVLEFANVSRKVIGHQFCDGGLAHGLSTASQDVFDQQWYVFHSAAQRRNGYGKYVQTVIQILSELASANHRHQFAIRCGDHTQVEFAHDNITQSAELAVL